MGMAATFIAAITEAVAMIGAFASVIGLVLYVRNLRKK